MRRDFEVNMLRHEVAANHKTLCYRDMRIQCKATLGKAGKSTY